MEFDDIPDLGLFPVSYTHLDVYKRQPKYDVDPYKMLEEEKPDIISVCTPNAYHKEYTPVSYTHLQAEYGA